MKQITGEGYFEQYVLSVVPSLLSLLPVCHEVRHFTPPYTHHHDVLSYHGPRNNTANNHGLKHP
jgi:hypothetical protein